MKTFPQAGTRRGLFNLSRTRWKPQISPRNIHTAWGRPKRARLRRLPDAPWFTPMAKPSTGVGIDAKTGRYPAVDPATGETCLPRRDTGAAARLISSGAVLSAIAGAHPLSTVQSRRSGRETMSRAKITGGGTGLRRLCTTDGGGGRDGTITGRRSLLVRRVEEETGAVALAGAASGVMSGRLIPAADDSRTRGPYRCFNL